MSSNLNNCDSLNIDSLFKEDIHAEVEEALNKNIITDEDIEKYQMNQDASLTAKEFLDLINTALSGNVEESTE